MLLLLIAKAWGLGIRMVGETTTQACLEENGKKELIKLKSSMMCAGD